jgi:hypothetical protein
MPEPIRPQDVPADLVAEFQRAELMAVLDVDEGADPVRAVLAHFLPAHERQVRERLAAEYRDAAHAIEASAGENDDPLSNAIWTGCHASQSAPCVVDDPRTIAIVAYRHLASRLTEEDR